MSNVTISDSIKYIGVDDTTLDLFESQYIVPNGVSYNSYVILDEKVAVMDTVDARKTDEIRPIWCDCGFIPRTHGSGLFTRGQTQVMSIATLGALGDVQILDGLDEE